MKVDIEPKELLETLSGIQHTIWTRWMKHLFEVCPAVNGQVIIPKEKVDRWLRQMRTPYEDLSESEKDSDREIAEEVLAVVLSQHFERVQSVHDLPDVIIS